MIVAFIKFLHRYEVNFIIMYVSYSSLLGTWELGKSDS